MNLNLSNKLKFLHFLGVPSVILLSNFFGVGAVIAAPPLGVLDELFNAPSPSSSGSPSILTEALQREISSLPGPTNNVTIPNFFLRNLPFTQDLTSTSQLARTVYNSPRNGPSQLPFSPSVPSNTLPLSPVQDTTPIPFAQAPKWFIDSKRRPVEGNNKVDIIQDAPDILKSMYDAIQTATGSGHYIYMCNWMVDENLKMSYEDNPDPTSNTDPTLLSVLTEASKNEVQIRSLLFGPGHPVGKDKGNLDLALDAILAMPTVVPTLPVPTFPSGQDRQKLGNYSAANRYGNYRINLSFANEINKLKNGVAYLDEKRLTWGTHHQKLLIVRGEKGLIAFCGSFDPTYDRENWNELAIRVQGPVAYRLAEVFLERWKDAASDIPRDELKKSLSTEIGQSLDSEKIDLTTGGIPCQVTVTTGNMKDNEPANANLKPYQFAPTGEMSFREALIHAIDTAEDEIYLECQYGWGESLGHDQVIRSKLAEAAKRNVKIIVVTPKQKDVPDYGVQDALVVAVAGPAGAMLGGWERRSNNQKGSVFGGILGALSGYGSATSAQVFSRAQDFQRLQDKFWHEISRVATQPIEIYHTDPVEHYVHAKLWIFDDEFALIGSGNFNNRSLSHDSEVMVGLYHPARLSQLRIDRLAKHMKGPEKGLKTQRYIVPKPVGDDLKGVGDLMTDSTLPVTDPYGGPGKNSQRVETALLQNVETLNRQIEKAKENDLNK